MKKIFEEYKNIVINIARNRSLIFIMIFFIILSYGFSIFHPSIGIDDTSFYRFYYGGEMISQGRIFFILIGKVLKNLSFEPVFSNLIFLLLISFSALLYCSLFYKISKNKISNKGNIIFCILFITFPLIAEIYIYDTITIVLGIGYFLSSIITILFYEFYKSDFKNRRILIYNLFLIILLASSYESFVSVLIWGIFAFIFLVEKYDKANKFKTIIKLLIVCSLTIFIAIALEYLLGRVLLNIFNMEKSMFPAYTFYWKTDGFSKTLINLYNSIKTSFIENNYSLFSINVYTFSVVIFFAYSIIESIKKHNIKYFIFILLIILSTLSLSFVQGVATPYRACQVFGLFVAFVYMVVFENSIRMKNIIFVLIVYLALLQAKDLNFWIYNDYLRYQEEKQYMLLVSSELKSNYDTSKPIVFVGYYNMSNNIKISQTNGSSIINWGIVAFGNPPGGELIKFLEMHGQYFKTPSLEQQKEAFELYEKNTFEHFPRKGSILEKENYIIVNISN